MQITSLFSLALSLVSLLFSAQNSFALEVTETLSKPESAILVGNTLYVSNIDAQSEGGSSRAKDKVGWISKIQIKFSKDKTLTLGATPPMKIAQGLSAPKGLRAYKRKILYVADIDQVVAIDLKTDQILKSIQIPGAKFLNDLEIDSRGDVFVADTLGNKIFKISRPMAPSPEVSTFVENMEQAPNGLLMDSQRRALLVAAWGSKINDAFKVEGPGHVFSVNLKTRKISQLTKTPLGQLDGIEFVSRNEIVVSAKLQNRIYKIALPTGESTEVCAANPDLDSIQPCLDPADIGYDPKSRTLLIPSMKQNMLVTLNI